ncbi:hypothetical protein AMECASPLE_031922 [Ameca splendens]|uniref:Uncharacterized protein n=1 Tax=Ameca splendens TaxID=208324 RepID=A0ABV0XJC5_9TELE
MFYCVLHRTACIYSGSNFEGLCLGNFGQNVPPLYSYTLLCVSVSHKTPLNTDICVGNVTKCEKENEKAVNAFQGNALISVTLLNMLNYWHVPKYVPINFTQKPIERSESVMLETDAVV